MSHIQQTVCDAPNCGQVKGESNHWWRVRNAESFVVSPYSDAELVGDLHYCSSQCMHKMLDLWMEVHMPKVVASRVDEDSVIVIEDRDDFPVATPHIDRFHRAVAELMQHP